MSEPNPGLWTLIGRGWRRKCPRCGRGNIYKGWLRMHDYCPDCGLKYLENQGDLFGPFVFVDRVLFLIPVVVLFYFGIWHPSIPELFLFGGSVVFLLIYTAPHRNGVSLAIDYYIRRKSGG